MPKQKLALAKVWQFLIGHKIWVALILVTIAGGIAGWYFILKPKDTVRYISQEVTYGDITETINASGTVKPVQQVTLTFKSQGYVQNSYVQVGDKVKKGQVLAEEHDNDFQSQLAQAEGNLQSAEANYNKLVSTQPQKIDVAKAQLDQVKSNLDLAKTTLERNQSLFEAGAITRAELDNVKNNYQSALTQYQSSVSNLSLVSNSDDIAAATAQVKAAQAQVKLARSNLAGSKIIAPFDGYVSQINGNAGQWTQGGAPPAGTSLSSQYGIILSSTDLQMSAEINEADISKVKIGQQVTFTVNTYPNKTFKGKIISLSPMAHNINNVQMYEAILSIDDYSQLKAGMPSAVNIIIASAKHVPVIPQSALDYARSYIAGTRQNPRQNIQGGDSVQPQDKSYVLVLEHGQPVLKPVQTGLSDDVNVEIKSGLAPGETIIVGQTGTGAGKSSGVSVAPGNSGRTGGGYIPGLGGMGRAFGGR